MESQFVLVVDVDSLETDRDLNMMYVAMSRAKSSLWVALPRTMEQVVTDLQMKNWKPVMEDLKREHP
jgi:ATP-dependent exoDNAse (exonuclease V) beta subunit